MNTYCCRARCIRRCAAKSVCQHFTHEAIFCKKSLPIDLASDLPDGTLVIPDDLLNPKRQKFTGSTTMIVPVAAQQSSVQQFRKVEAWLIANICNNVDDGACLRDLSGFSELAEGIREGSRAFS